MNNPFPPPPPPLTTRRGMILHDALSATEGDRQSTYGDPIPNLSLAGTLKRVVRDRADRYLSPAEQEAIDLLLTKVARIVTGTYHRDNYVDAAAYAALAGEAAAEYETQTAVSSPNAASKN